MLGKTLAQGLKNTAGILALTILFTMMVIIIYVLLPYVSIYVF